MLAPKKVAHRKWQKGRKRNQGVATRNVRLSFGSFGLKSQGHAHLTSRQLEAARRVIAKYIKRSGKVWTRVFPDRPITKKGAETPMGSGKGAVDHYVCIVKPGTIVFEMEGVDLPTATEAMTLAAYKLPMKTKFISK